MRPRPALADLRPYEPGKPAAAGAARARARADRQAGLERGPVRPVPGGARGDRAPGARPQPLSGARRRAGRAAGRPPRRRAPTGSRSETAPTRSSGCSRWPTSTPATRRSWAGRRSSATASPRSSRRRRRCSCRCATASTTSTRWPSGSARAPASSTSATPTTPPARWSAASRLRAFLDRVPEDVLVVVDEAYHEYVTDPDYPDAIAEHVLERPNVAALRTFSKIYGLAGLRVGYMVGPGGGGARGDEGARRRSTSPSSPTSPRSRAWTTRAELARRRDLNERGRADLVAALAAAGMTPFPACANFLAVEVGDGRALARALEADGVIVRPLEPFGAPGSVRDHGGHARRERRLRRRAAAGAAAAVSRRPTDLRSLVDGVSGGDTRAVARAITLVENRDPLAYELVRELYPRTGSRRDRRLHRAAGGRQVEPDRVRGRVPARRGAAGGGGDRRPVEPVLARGAARRPHPPGRPLHRRGRVHPLDEHPRPPGRRVRGDAAGAARARRGRDGRAAARDGRRGPERGRGGVARRHGRCWCCSRARATRSRRSRPG